jgi:hypothetical protein
MRSQGRSKESDKAVEPEEQRSRPLTSQFTVLVTFGTTATVTLNPQALFEGASTSLSGLQIGWSVEAHGFYQADGSLLATDVNSAVHA